VLGFNLAVTGWIGEWRLVAAGLALHATVALAVYGWRHASSAGFAGALDAGEDSEGAPRPLR
jgi:hypothetical protein